MERYSILRYSNILNVLDGGSNVLLYGPRRYGKSSLMGEVLQKIHSKGGLCSELNMMDVASLEDFIDRYARVVYRELSPVSEALNALSGFLKRLSPSIGLDDEGYPELRISFASGRATVDSLREVLTLPERLCGANRKIVIAIDEFQEVSKAASTRCMRQSASSWRIHSGRIRNRSVC